MSRKPRIDKEGPSPLQMLKALPEAEHEFIEEQAEQLSLSKLAAQIGARHGIHGLSDRRLSDFLRWRAEQREVRAANESVANIREIFAEVMPGASTEETHKFLLHYLTSLGFTKPDATSREKALKFVTVETRKAVDLSQKDRRIKLLEKQAEQARKTLENPSLSEEDQNRRIREIFKK